MSDSLEWFTVSNTDELDSPVLLIYPERVKSNIRLAIEMVGDLERLRPHVKTNKSPSAIRLMMEAGIKKFKCATIAEAEMLGQEGARDVLLAYQPLGPKLKRFVRVIKKFPDTAYSCLTDNIIIAREQSELFSSHYLRVPVYLDLNLGMNRTGIVPGKDAIDLYSFIASAPGIRAAGIHAYDGHIRHQDIELRKIKADEAFDLVLDLKNRIEERGFDVPVIVAGGSPTFPIHASRGEVECSPGTFIYWDKGYSDGCPEQKFLPAAVLLTRVVSQPSVNIVCTDLGHKSVAAENDISKRVFFLNTEALKPISQSEEHLVAEVAASHNFKTGDILYGLPFHICPTVALYERVYTVEDNKLSGEWRNTARDRKINI